MHAIAPMLSLLVLPLSAPAAQQEATSDARAYLGTWNLDNESYLRAQMERVERQIENVKDGFDDMPEERRARMEELIQQDRERTREQAEEKEMRFTFGADGAFELTSRSELLDETYESTYRGEWVTHPRGVVLFALDAAQRRRNGAEDEDEPYGGQLNWAGLLEGTPPAVTVAAGRIVALDSGIGFELTEPTSAESADVPHAQAPSDDSPFVGTWQLDTAAIADAADSTFTDAVTKASASARRIKQEHEQKQEQEERAQDERTPDPDDDAAGGNTSEPPPAMKEAIEDFEENVSKEDLRQMVTGMRAAMEDSIRRMREADIRLTLDPDGAYRIHGTIPAPQIRERIAELDEDESDERPGGAERGGEDRGPREVDLTGDWWVAGGRAILIGEPGTGGLAFMFGAGEVAQDDVPDDRQIVLILERGDDGQLRHIAGTFPPFAAQPVNTLDTMDATAGAQGQDEDLGG